MESSNYNKLSEILDSNKSNSTPNENHSSSLEDHLNLLNQSNDDGEKKIEKNDALENNSEKSTESNKDSEKDKDEKVKSENNSTKEKIPKKKDKIKIKKKFSLGRNGNSLNKKPKKFEINGKMFLFGENAFKMFELLDVIKIKKPKAKSKTFEIFMKKKHMKIFENFPFFRKENQTINSDNSENLYPENFIDEEFDNHFQNIEDNIFDGNNNNNVEDILNFENIANISVNQPGYNIMPNEVLNNPSDQLPMMLPNGNFSINFSLSMNEASTDGT